MTGDRVEKIRAILARADADWAVLSSPEAVCYATGFAVPIETGRSPFSGGPVLAFVGRDGTRGLVHADVEGPAPADLQAAECYRGFPGTAENEAAAGYGRAVATCLARLSMGGRLAFEAEVPLHFLEPALGAGDRVGIGHELGAARAVKAPSEVLALERAAGIAAAGQVTARSQAQAGRTELAVFGLARTAMEELAGERLPVAGDFLSGRRNTARAGGWPGTRRLEAGDPILSDLAPRVGGYWGDSCGAFVLGRASPRYRAMFDACRSGLDAAMSALRPGTTAGAVDAACRRVVAAAGFGYSHHTGHGIGTQVHEHPRLIPDSPAPLAAGMVLMLEPGAYDPEVGGVRLEWMVLVEDDGCRALGPFGFAPERDAVPDLSRQF